MANELHAEGTTGLTVYCVLLDSTNQVWNGAAFEAINPANWLTYDIAMAEATAGIYLATMPAAAAGEYSYVAYDQAGVNPAIADEVLGVGWLSWDGAAEVVQSTIDTNVDAILLDTSTTLDGKLDAILLDTGTTGVVLASDSVTAAALAASAAEEIADAILARGVANVEATADRSSLAELILAAFESAIAAGVWTIYQTDHTTVFGTRAVTTSPAAEPIIEVT